MLSSLTSNHMNQTHGNNPAVSLNPTTQRPEMFPAALIKQKTLNLPIRGLSRADRQLIQPIRKLTRSARREHHSHKPTTQPTAKLANQEAESPQTAGGLSSPPPPPLQRGKTARKTHRSRGLFTSSSADTHSS